MDRFSPFRVRSPLLTESLLFSLPAGTEMFHFPAFPPRSLCVQLRVAPHDMVRGFPIRKSWYQRPVIDSSRLIADSHVLLRLPMPRHPPCALKNLTTNMIKNLHELKFITIERTKKDTHKACPPGSIILKKLLMQNRTKQNQRPEGHRLESHLFHKMLASTIQFPNNNPVTPTTDTHTLHGCKLCGLGHARETRKNKNHHRTPARGAGNGPVIPGPNSVPKDRSTPEHHPRSNHTKCGVLIDRARNRTAVAC